MNKSNEDSSNNTPPKLAIGLSVFLALAFIVAVIGGARIMTDRTTYTPAAVSPVNAPNADSAECTNVVNNFPNKVGSFKQVEIVAPAPVGAMAFKNSSGEELTVRCGVYVPDQYTVLSQTEEVEGVEWLTVTDATPGSNLKTYYQVGGTPTVAITSEADLGDALKDASNALSVHINSDDAPQPAAFPLSDTKLEDEGHPELCAKFLKTLPDTLAEYKVRDVSAIKGEPSQSRTYFADGKEPIVVRCGVELPDSYQAGATLSQIDNVPWFDEPGLAQGSTSGRWFALGRQAIVAAYMPGAQGNEVIGDLTKTILDTLPAE